MPLAALTLYYVLYTVRQHGPKESADGPTQISTPDSGSGP